MPPRTRASKITKGLKENYLPIDKSKPVSKIVRPARKVLADKTNSASDDNASTEIPKKMARKGSTNTKVTKVEVGCFDNDKPRRDRRLPNRYVENEMLKNLSNNQSPTLVSGVKTPLSVKSPFKTPQKVTETSLVMNRPKRICRLPSKFEDHSVSPNKFVPVQPFHASTPIVQNDIRNSNCGSRAKSISNHEMNEVNESTPKKKQAKIFTKQARQIETISKTIGVNTQLQGKTLRARNADTKNREKQSQKLSKPSPLKKDSTAISRSTKKIIISSHTETKSSNIPEKGVKCTSQINNKKPSSKNFPFRVLEDKSQSQNDGNLDVYEFTYDPNEEPPPQKKKRKRVVKRKPAKPKTFILKTNYEQNLFKTLATLKNVVSKKPTQTAIMENTVKIQETVPLNVMTDINLQAAAPSKTDTVKIIQNDTRSVQVEDIAADFEFSDGQELDYSPVNSPNGPTTSAGPLTKQSVERPIIPSNDPLNLRDDLSFFDDQPVASSSMNMSVRHPLASPWRVEFGNLPIKWHSNTYVKANMTPAVESSFVNFDDSKKKHVYTNMVPQSHETLPEIVNEIPNLMQTSILSFIKDVAEKSSNEKKAGISVSHTKPVFGDITNTIDPNQTPKNIIIPIEANMNQEDLNESEKENSVEDNSHENDIDPNIIPAGTPRKDNTFFGFDDSEDLENVSPKDIRKRALRPRARAGIKKINVQAGPTRAMLPIAAKSKAVIRHEEMITATDAPVFPEKNHDCVVQLTEVNEVTPLEDENNEDAQSLHLFEDIELVHYLKPSRRSYKKHKKVVFRQPCSITDDATQDSEVAHAQRDCSDEDDHDDLHDLTFEMPELQQKKTRKKKPTKKQKLTMKEEKEVEAWAAGFNSMCEDIEDFPLVVE